MKIKIISMWFNEEFLSRFFLNHYSWTDEIHILFDTDTTDNSRKIIESYSNTKIENFTFPDMFDDDLKIAKINEIYNNTSINEFDWIICVDSDEFIWPKDFVNPKECLKNTEFNCYRAAMWQVYKHKSELDLDYNKPTIFQRRYGDADINAGINALYIKPIIVKTGLKNLIWQVGNHKILSCENNIHYSNEYWQGTHWMMADENLAIERRIKGRKERFSKNQITKAYTHQHIFITEEEIKKICKEHENDKKLF